MLNLTFDSVIQAINSYVINNIQDIFIFLSPLFVLSAPSPASVGLESGRNFDMGDKRISSRAMGEEAEEDMEYHDERDSH